MIVQFGTSRFLQAHVDLFAHEAKIAGQQVPPIIVVQTTQDAARAARLRCFAAREGYEVILRGLDQGHEIERSVRVRSVVDGLNAHADWQRLSAIFTESATHIVSNTGDTGLGIAASDRSPALLGGAATPASFPAMLVALLHARWRAGREGLTILPCELVARNGAVLHDLVLGLAVDAGAAGAFVDWLAQSCLWINSLVDRIVSEPIEPAGAIAEPYALWAIEHQAGLAMPFTHPSIVLTTDLERFERLKLHILNLGHSWLAEQWSRGGADPRATVRSALDDPGTLAALRGVLSAEVVAGFAARGLQDEAARYVEDTIERFANPYLAHRLSDIYSNHAVKVAKRIGGFIEWVEASGSRPPPLVELRSIHNRHIAGS